MARRRRGSGIIFGLLAIGFLASIFSDDEEKTPTPGAGVAVSDVKRTSATETKPAASDAENAESLQADEPPPETDSRKDSTADAKPRELLASIKRTLAGDEDRTAPSFASARVMYTTSRLRMRDGPGTDFSIVTTLDKGIRVSVSETQGDWLHASVHAHAGWVHKDFVTERPIEAKKTPVKRETQPVQRLVRQSPERKSGQPMRDPFVGTCDCPYDLMRNGRRCGGRSAYSRPGGRSPQCYF